MDTQELKAVIIRLLEKVEDARLLHRIWAILERAR